ncbi:MAG: NAD(P)-binding domain-containing protein [Sphingorhabdus sp.]|uniref:NAD(P)-binding domain-containing protein n=1 Tax=Sphingorhabdus sp. TaxID=1902408 RepID=UPI003C98BD22
MPFDPLLIFYAVPFGLIWALWHFSSVRKARAAIRVMEDAKEAGLTEPASLHPVIDPALCLGCAACIKACPEKQILGIIDGKAALIEPTHCVGHGACARSCPTDAITLVFGTETRGVDIPHVSPTFETNVPGIFIAGELGGMGLIKNAIEQGRQAVEFALKRAKEIPAPADALDILIIGAGPAGIAASLGALAAKARYRTVDQYSLGGTVAHFPRGKVVMTAPAELPIVGKVKFGEVSKEELLEFWEGVVRDTGVELQLEERVDAISREEQHFVIETSKAMFRTKTVLLAIGRRGTPRQLGVPGEELSKVVYRLIDPEQYRGQKVLVVGGGDSALEAAGSIAEIPDTHVTLSYRSDAFGRARAKNRDRVNAAAAAGQLEVILNSTVAEIAPDQVSLNTTDGLRSLPNDAVIVCAGGILPTAFLKEIGVQIETKFGTA